MFGVVFGVGSRMFGVGSRIVTSAILRPRPPTRLFSSAYACAQGQDSPIHILSSQKSSRIHINPQVAEFEGLSRPRILNLQKPATHRGPRIRPGGRWLRVVCLGARASPPEKLKCVAILPQVARPDRCLVSLTLG